MGNLLALQRTAPTRDEFATATRVAWLDVTGQPMSDVAMAVLYGQFAFETGWGRSCWNWNLGNVRTGPIKPPAPVGWEGDYTELKSADEYINGKRVIVGGYFRAFLSLAEGSAEHLTFLSGLRRYANAWRVLNGPASQAVESEAPAIATAFVAALKAGGYFTGDEKAYASGVADIARWFLKGLPHTEPVREVWPLHALDPKRYEPAWVNLFSAQGVLDSLFEHSIYNATDHRTLTGVLLCRYDCEDMAA